MSEDELNVFLKRYFTNPPSLKGKILIRTLWHKIQCENHNLHVRKKHITQLKKYSKDPESCIEKSYKKNYHLRSGMEIVRQYSGKEHRVLVRAPDQYVYNNKTYQTISAVAKAICGKKVSGYDFFGLNNKSYKKNIVKEDECKK